MKPFWHYTVIEISHRDIFRKFQAVHSYIIYGNCALKFTLSGRCFCGLKYPDGFSLAPIYISLCECAVVVQHLLSVKGFLNNCRKRQLNFSLHQKTRHTNIFMITLRILTFGRLAFLIWKQHVFQTIGDY